MIGFDMVLDLFPFTAALLASIVCALLGNFLVLRRLSLMGDAISHSVLPGLVIAFVITASRSPRAMFLGAALAGVVTVVLVELVKRLGRVEPGAAMGVVFSVLFALGVLLIEAYARQTDLDADCVLHGNLEDLVWWGAPDSVAGLFSGSTIEAIPRQVRVLLGMTAAAFVFVGLFFKELRIAAFDPAMSTAQGIHAGVMHYALMIFVAAATVASFEAVGSILVIAMLVCPASTARLLTDRLRAQLLLSLVISVASAVLGYWGATAVPALLERDSVNAAGSITVVSGLMLASAAVFSPMHGALGRVIRRRRLVREIMLDDLLAALYRHNELGISPTPISKLYERLRPAIARRVIRRAARADLINRTGSDSLTLTVAGSQRAENIVRRHRLWEQYLVSEAGFAADHVHEPAELLEHTPVVPRAASQTDPHGKPIPPVNKKHRTDG